jgi:glycosyltransferase involved in cell wall biosynthesis
MNILNVTSITELRGGDAQMYSVYNLLKEKTDLKQFILCPDDAVLASICKKDKAAYYTYKKTKLKLINLIVAIIKTCKKESISVIHIHDSSALNAGLIAMRFLPNNTSLILSRKRNNKIKDKFLNRYKYSHPDIKKIISVSKAVEAIFDTIIKDKERLVTIYDAIDVKKIGSNENKNSLHQEFNFSTDTKIVGTIAGLTPQKDLFTFIDTAKQIHIKNNTSAPIKFVIIGEGSLHNELVLYAKEQDLEDTLFFTGFRNDATNVLPEFDVFLITSITEGLPLSVYEAFACKVPVVATKAGGIPEVVVNGETGFLANFKDSETLANRVLEILNDTNLREKIKKNAFELVTNNHDLKVMQTNYYNFYQNLKRNV